MMKKKIFFIFIKLFLLLSLSSSQKHAVEVTSLYENYSRAGSHVQHSPDPLVDYRWENPTASDRLEHYVVKPISVKSDSSESVSFQDIDSIYISGPCTLMFDFG